MGEEPCFRSHFQVVGERRDNDHDDRRLYRARSPAQCWRSKKNGAQAIGRSRGGLTTKIHALVDAMGNPVELMLTPGQDHDLTCAEPLIENADPEALIGDKAYDADPFVETLTQRGITPVIPPKANRNIKRECDFALYCCERNLIERFFNLLKHFRAIATRYDKLARNCLAGVQLAAVTILLN
jgi:transposase